MARSHDQAKLDRQLASMRTACEKAAEDTGATVEFVAEEIYRTYKIDESARPYREAAAAIRSIGLEVIPRKSGGGTDGNYFNAKGIPCVALPTGMVDEHAATEHIAINDLVMAARILLAIVTLPPEEQGLCAQSRPSSVASAGHPGGGAVEHRVAAGDADAGPVLGDGELLGGRCVPPVGRVLGGARRRARAALRRRGGRHVHRPGTPWRRRT